MKDAWLEKWDDRYREEGFAFGIHPNEYLKEKLETLTPGEILFPAEGEGRNAVYAARKGWDVSAFDISEEGKKKADQLAGENNVQIEYEVGPLELTDYAPDQFDALALIYAHFPSGIKAKYHQELITYLKSGGYVILEAFSKNHLPFRKENSSVGGPTNLEELFSIDEVKKDFSEFEVIELIEKEVELNEGEYHKGKGSVIRFFGRKK